LEEIVEFPVLEAAYRIGLIYTSLLPAQYRTNNGIYYTPPALANRLLDQAETAGIDWKAKKQDAGFTLASQPAIVLKIIRLISNLIL